MILARKSLLFGPVLLLVSALIIVVNLPALAGNIYKWQDKNGHYHFTDSEANIPAEYRSKVNKRKTDPSVESVFSTPGSNSDTGTDQSAPVSEEEGNSFSIPYVDKEGSANRVIIEMVFNGHVKAPILVDTGSPGLVISSDLAEQLGLLSAESSRLLVAIGGIGGSTQAIRTIVDKVQIGKVKEEFIPAHIVQKMAKAYQGLVGMDILANYTLTIDSSNHRLVAKENPANQNLPAGRTESWWRSNFREFNHYYEFWNNQLKMLDDSNSPYRSLSTSKREKYKRFIEQQFRESKNLLDQLDRFARFNSVPRHWRR